MPPETPRTSSQNASPTPPWARLSPTAEALGVGVGRAAPGPQTWHLGVKNSRPQGSPPTAQVTLEHGNSTCCVPAPGKHVVCGLALTAPDNLAGRCCHHPHLMDGSPGPREGEQVAQGHTACSGGRERVAECGAQELPGPMATLT